MKKYPLAILVLLVTIVWIYFTDPRYTKPILAALPAFLIILANSFYESKVILLAAIGTTLFWGLSLFYYWRINALPSPYEIYLIYLFLFMTAIISFPLVQRTRKIFVELEEEKNKTQSIITNLADGLLFFDRESKLSLINSQAKDFFKIDAEKIVGLSLRELSQISEIAPLANLFGRKIKKVFRKELPISKNLILEVSTTPILKRKEGSGSLVILHDITREKTIERLKTEFVSISAHQLRTPLSKIKWALTTLLDGDLGKITPDQKEVLEKSYESNEKMLILINDLLNLSKIEEGRYLFKLTSCQIEEIIQSIIDSHQEKIKIRKIKIEFKKPKKKLPKVKVDLEKIKLAIDNLVDNALKYTPVGGKAIISLKKSEKEICFQIKDTGVGIPKNQQDRIFSKFFRASNIKRMQSEGTGLGLFIAKNIIEAHKGKIWFESEEKKGSTFYFTLPIKAGRVLKKV
jgi:PAS domain S-box-containing protein